ncbi:MAG: GntR family transcriptional regulator [Gemmatimonadota bacterium]|nr:GntR family transcriptional regulator [Gemmatimonadota bacterium]
MLISLDPQDARPIYVQIVDEVRRALALGTLGPDDPLPSVRDLAVTLRVNPNTVSQAYRELERQGMVYVRRGQGTYASPNGADGTERSALAEGVAQRALNDARRNGLSTDELVEAIRNYEPSRDDGESR